MDSPLLYLTLCSLRNRLRVRLRRLREPRYLIGTIVGLAYFYMVFGRPRARARRAGSPLESMGPGRGPIELAGALIMFSFIALAWLWPGSRRPALTFSRADVQLLFTAPISRRRLVRYKVLRSQVGSVVTSGIMTLLFRRSDGAWMFFIGMTLLMALLNLHMTGISLNRAYGTVPGQSGFARHLPRAIVAAAVAVLALTLVTHWAALTALAASGSDVLVELQRLATTGPAGVVLWPFTMLVRLPLAESWSEFSAPLLWTVLMLAVNYIWVQRLDVPFEEASAELSEKIARLREGGTTTLRPRRPVATPFPLALNGRPETAILWKNLIQMGRYLSWTLLLRVVPLIVFCAFVFRGSSRSDSAPVPAILCLAIAALTVVVGPQIVRSDLRYDLANLSVLKTWPLRGATLVRGELLAPAIVLTAIVSLAMVTAAVLSMGVELTGPITNRWGLLLAALMVAPGIILAQLLVQNGLAVTFPAWVGIGRPRGGVDVMGQRMVMLVATLVALVATVLPAAIVGGLAALVYYSVAGSITVVVPGLLAAVTLFGEAFLGSELVGTILDRTDLTAIDALED